MADRESDSRTILENELIFGVRRRERKNITSGIAHVNASFNNTMVTITDAQGARTRVQLTTLQPAPGLAASLFQLRDPTRRNRRN